MARSSLKFRMNDKLHVRLKREARKTGRPLDHLVKQAIEIYLDRKEAERLVGERLRPA